MNISNATIKDSIRQRAMTFWGIEDDRMLDPVIELLVDVIAYEFSRLEQSVKVSDSKLLERIAKILVKESWSLPLPAHALLQGTPSRGEMTLSRKSQFYVQKLVGEGQYADVFFTPISSHKLVNAKLKCVAHSEEMVFMNDVGLPSFSIRTKKDKRMADYTMWAGIEIDRGALKELETLDMAMILSNSGLDSYLRLTQAYNVAGDPMELSPIHKGENKYNEHYFESVQRYYQNFLYTIALNEHKKLMPASEVFANYFYDEDLEDNNADLFWVKLKFPVAFSAEELAKLQISLNTFPVVNRRIQYKQHNVRRNGKIISLRTINELFLNVENLIDNHGRKYMTTTAKDISDVKGSYSLYFGELEQFDERNAKAILEQVMQKVREEGSSFSAIGYDLLNAYLEDLNKKLDVLERKVSIGYKNISFTNSRQYLLTIPYDDAQLLECNYWTTDADAANGLTKNTKLLQFQSSGIVTKSIRLLTDTVGGNYKNTSKEKISHLRYGLIAKDRIVSKEDIVDFVKILVGKTVKRVEVKSGVGISPNKKQGLMRTTDVFIAIQNDNLMTDENKKRLENYLQSELSQRSVHNLPFNIIIN